MRGTLIFWQQGSRRQFLCTRDGDAALLGRFESRDPELFDARMDAFIATVGQEYDLRSIIRLGEVPLFSEGEMKC